MEQDMNRTSTQLIGAALITFTLGSSMAFAQGTMAQQNACRPDVFRLCGNFIPDVGEIVACLRGNEARLSEACHQVMFSEHAESRYVTPGRAQADSDEQDSEQQ
jgi:hypothetical protein